MINFNVNTIHIMEYLPSVAQIQGLCESFLHKLPLCICSVRIKWLVRAEVLLMFGACVTH